MNFSDANTKITATCLNVNIKKQDGLKKIDVKRKDSPLNITIDTFDKINVRITNRTENIKIKCNPVFTNLKVILTPWFDKFITKAICINKRPNVSYNIVCATNLSVGHYFMVREGLFILADGNKFELVK